VGGGGTAAGDPLVLPGSLPPPCRAAGSLGWVQADGPQVRRVQRADAGGALGQKAFARTDSFPRLPPRVALQLCPRPLAHTRHARANIGPDGFAPLPCWPQDHCLDWDDALPEEELCATERHAAKVPGQTSYGLRAAVSPNLPLLTRKPRPSLAKVVAGEDCFGVEAS